MMIKEIDYFEEASGWFLTEKLTWEEFDKTLTDGFPLPLAPDYANWDPDYVESQIKALASDIERIAKEEVKLYIKRYEIE